jgi:mannose-6-phosphate isomerase-like protein (cupin superfamily)
MSSLEEFLNSGTLEMYVMGQLDAAEIKKVESMAALFPEVANEINEISIALEQYATTHAVQPNPSIKPFLMATINYMDRIESGELPNNPPILHEGSQIIDYKIWLDRRDLQLNQELKDAYAHIIGLNDEAITAIVWLKQGALPEEHTNEIEQFLIVEGTCDITIGEQVYSLIPGSFLRIPRYENHYVQVTSNIPCKIILQRVALAA